MTLYLASGFIALFISFLLKKGIIQFLLQGNMSKPNYKGNLIPLGMGILILISTVISSCFLILIKSWNSYIFLFLAGIGLTGFVGIIDDFLGNHSVKGLKGHLSELFFHNTITTGGIKAIVGGLTAFIITATISQEPLEWIIHFFLIALSINILNLFDVRPGRAIKFFIFLSMVLLFINRQAEQYFFIIVLGATLPVVNGDFKGSFMLGDVGSNILGFTIGLCIVLIESMGIKLLFLLSFIIMQLIAEKSSISLVIDKYKVLHYLDQWGTLKK